jgi:hypothetical protein
MFTDGTNFFYRSILLANRQAPSQEYIAAPVLGLHQDGASLQSPEHFNVSASMTIIWPGKCENLGS